MANLTSAGHSVSLTVPAKGDTASVALSGTYAAVVALQREQGSPGSGAWEELKRWSTANATVAYGHVVANDNERLRLFAVSVTSGTVVATLTDTQDMIIREEKDPQGNVIFRLFQDGPVWYNVYAEVVFDGRRSERYIHITDATTYTFLAANTGKTHLAPDLTADATWTLPAPDDGLEFFIEYVGAAADAHDWLINTHAAGTFIKGGLLHLDTDAGAGADELIPVFWNGSSHVAIDFDTPNCGTTIRLRSDGTLWYVSGIAAGVGAPAAA